MEIEDKVEGVSALGTLGAKAKTKHVIDPKSAVLRWSKA